MDKSLWHQLLPGQLAPKALKVFSALSLEQSCSYDEIKTAVLNSCKLSEATYLQNFRNLRRSGAMSYEEHLTRLRDSYSKYIDAANITSFDDLFDCVIKEQFMSTLHPDVRSFVLSKQPATSLDCAKFAQLSFQIKQDQNQGFMRAANTFVERPAFARPEKQFQRTARQPHFTRANRPPMGRGGPAGPNVYQQRGGPSYYQRTPTMNARNFSPTLYARTRENRKRNV